MHLGGVHVLIRFEGVAPHRPEVLHSLPAHAVSADAPEWVIRVRALGAGFEPPDSGVDADGFSVRFPAETPREASLFIDPARRKKEFDAAIGAALYMVLRREARLDLHAAAVVPPIGGPGAVLIVGPKGAGKSSLTLSLAMAGWRFLSDDYVLAWSGDAQIRLGCLRSSLYLTPDAVDRLPEKRPPGRDVPRMGKRMFDAEPLFPGQHMIEAPLAAVVFPERVPDGSSSLEPIRAVESFQRLLALTPFLAADPSARPCLDVARSVADLPSFVLRAAPDILDPKTASSLLEIAFS